MAVKMTPVTLDEDEGKLWQILREQNGPDRDRAYEEFLGNLAAEGTFDDFPRRTDTGVYLAGKRVCGCDGRVLMFAEGE